MLAAPAARTPQLSAATYLAGSLICHQQPERSFHYAGAQYPVCARCLGLYLGAVLGVAAWGAFSGMRTCARPRARHTLDNNAARRMLIVAAVPTAVTVALAWAGVADASNTIRAALAVPLGAAIAATVAAVAAGDLR